MKFIDVEAEGPTFHPRASLNQRIDVYCQSHSFASALSSNLNGSYHGFDIGDERRGLQSFRRWSETRRGGIEDSSNCGSIETFVVGSVEKLTRRSNVSTFVANVSLVNKRKGKSKTTKLINNLLFLRYLMISRVFEKSAGLKINIIAFQIIKTNGNRNFVYRNS